MRLPMTLAVVVASISSGVVFGQTVLVNKTFVPSDPPIVYDYKYAQGAITGASGVDNGGVGGSEGAFLNANSTNAGDF